MQFYVDRNTPAVDRVRWPAKPKDTAALKPEDETILKLLEQYGCESFRVHDGWAVVHDTASTYSELIREACRRYVAQEVGKVVQEAVEYKRLVP